MSPEPKWLSALLPLVVAPRNSFCPVLEPTARYVACTGTLARAVIRPSSSQKSFDGLVVPAPCNCRTSLTSRAATRSSTVCPVAEAAKSARHHIVATFRIMDGARRRFSDVTTTKTAPRKRRS
eukprot:scaffold30865_cov46-Phaeocystis_antarctica.AAC.1